MANKEHLALIKQGVGIWNQWRNEYKRIVPDLSEAELRDVDLSGANLSKADLSKADLSKADLSGADLSGANLSGANLSGANLSGANLSRANLDGANLDGADPTGADPTGADPTGANLDGANLSGADPTGADLSKKDFSGVVAGSVPEDTIPDEDFDITDEATVIILNSAPDTANDSVTVRNFAPPNSEVQFTAYYPRDAKVNNRYSFLLYAHTEEAFENVVDDVEKFRDELGDKVPSPKTAKQTTQLILGTLITVVPECEQIEFDPPSLTKKWGGEWTRFGFDFKPAQAMSGDTLFVRVSIQVAAVEVAHINCAVEVIEQKTESPQYMAEVENPLAEAKFNSSTSELYQTIFISYSRQDKEVVKAYKLVQEAVGNVAFMDTYSIRAGEDWRSALAHAIDQADIFQLFWSYNSAGSPNVRDEWEYALKYKCPKSRCVGFIRPVCWNDPIAPSPPETLNHLNFKYVPLDHKRVIFSRLWARIVSLLP